MAYTFKWASQADGTSLSHDKDCVVKSKKGYTKKTQYDYMWCVNATINDEHIEEILKANNLNIDNLDIDLDAESGAPLVAGILNFIEEKDLAKIATEQCT